MERQRTHLKNPFAKAAPSLLVFPFYEYMSPISSWPALANVIPTVRMKSNPLNNRLLNKVLDWPNRDRSSGRGFLFVNSLLFLRILFADTNTLSEH
jgi:hypothetical protein